MPDIITTNPNEVLNIPEKDCPMMVFSDNIRSFFSWGIKLHQHGVYNHFMWLVRPGILATQDTTFKEVPIEKYLEGNHRLKFIRGKWDKATRIAIVLLLKEQLNLPFIQRLYDPLQIVGKFLHLNWLQIPGHSRICSDFGYILGRLDQEYDLKHPSPTEVNLYTKAHPNKYEVYLRFIPD